MEINREYPLYTQTDEKKREHGRGHGGNDGGGRRDVTPTEIFMGYRWHDTQGPGAFGKGQAV